MGTVDSSKRESLKKTIKERMVENSKLDVYFPLVRRGKYKVSFNTTVTDSEGNKRIEPVFLMFEDKKHQREAVARAKADKNTYKGEVKEFEGDNNKDSYNNPPDGSFVADVLQVITASGKDSDSEIQQQVMRLFIEALPESSYAKSLQKRGVVAGYETSVRGAMLNKGYDLSAQVAKMESAGQIRAIDRKIKEVVRPNKVSSDRFNRIKEELGKRSKFARLGANNKNIEPVFQRLNQVAFIYTIGFNASSALVNLSQIPMMVGPFMSGKFGVDETVVAMGRAGKFVTSAKLSIDEYYNITKTKDKNGNVTSEYSLKPEIEKKLRASAVDEKAGNITVAQYKRRAKLVEKADARGHLYHSELKDAQGIDELGRGGNKNLATKALDTTSALSAVMFSTAERFNRQTTLVMGYDLVLDQMKNKKRVYSSVQGKFVDVPSSSEARMDFAADEAIYLAQELNGGTVLETASGLSQQGVGRLALMYKSHGMQMYYTMIQAAKLLINNIGGKDAESRQLRAMAFKQLAAVHVSALMFSGVYGLPLTGAGMMLFDIFAYDDEEDDSRTRMRKYLGEGWYKGPLTEALGVDVASRIALSHLVLQGNRYNREASVEETIGFYLGGPSISTINRGVRAATDFGEGEYERAAENLAPAGLTNFVRSALPFGRYQREGGIRTRRFDPIYDDLSVGEFAAQALGFPPAEYIRIQERNMRNKSVEKSIVDRRTRLTKKYYVAARKSDFNTMTNLRLEMVEFNERHPSVAITPENIMNSIDSHLSTTAKMHNGVTINPLMDYAIRRSNEEYRQ